MTYLLALFLPGKPGTAGIGGTLDLVSNLMTLFLPGKPGTAGIGGTLDLG